MPESLHVTPLTINRVSFRHAWSWIVGGFDLFKTNPVMWIVIFMIYLAIIIPVSRIPVVGSAASTLLAPVFSAGIMWGCQALEQQQDLEINHLFAGFKKNRSQLFAVGGIYMLSLIMIAIALVLMLSKETIDILVAGRTLSHEQASAAILPLVIAITFLMPALMAYWFAPALVSLDNMSAVKAMKLSFLACLYNFLPFILYGVIAMLLLILAIIPFGLGLIVAIPVMMTSLYVSYMDVFGIARPED